MHLFGLNRDHDYYFELPREEERRRRLAHGANRNDSSCSRPGSRHSRFLQRRPSLSATACNWFMIRVRVYTIR